MIADTAVATFASGTRTVGDAAHLEVWVSLEMLRDAEPEALAVAMNQRLSGLHSVRRITYFYRTAEDHARCVQRIEIWMDGFDRDTTPLEKAAGKINDTLIAALAAMHHQPVEPTA
jgi:hypothetical protein